LLEIKTKQIVTASYKSLR